MVVGVEDLVAGAVDQLRRRRASELFKGMAAKGLQRSAGRRSAGKDASGKDDSRGASPLRAGLGAVAGPYRA